MPRLSPEEYETEIRQLRDRLAIVNYEPSVERRAGAKAMLRLIIEQANRSYNGCVSLKWLHANEPDLPMIAMGLIRRHEFT